MTAQVTPAADGELRVSSLAAADRTGTQHASVLRLIRDNLADFETFGRVGFEIAPFETPGGVQRREVAYLNEQQATLLVTFMRNSDVVRAFKVALVGEFYEMRQQLARPAVPQNFADALELAAAEVRRAAALEATNRELAPKAERWDDIASAEGDFSVGDAAKMLARAGVKTGERRLFAVLDEKRWTFTRGGRRQAMQAAIEAGYVTERAYTPRTDPYTGELRQVAPQIRVSGKGLDRLAADFGVGVQLEAVSA